jgi:hypothetical protein
MSKEITTISGELIDVRHLTTVHGGGADGYVDIWTAVHQEIWLRQADSTETQITIPRNLFPARTGHHVTVLLDDGEVIGFINWTTRQRVNYLLVGRPVAFRLVDVKVVALMLVASAIILGNEGLPIFVILVLLYLPIVWFRRSRRHSRRMRDVETRLEKLIEHNHQPEDERGNR